MAGVALSELLMPSSKINKVVFSLYGRLKEHEQLLLDIHELYNFGIRLFFVKIASAFRFSVTVRVSACKQDIRGLIQRIRRVSVTERRWSRWTARIHAHFAAHSGCSADGDMLHFTQIALYYIAGRSGEPASCCSRGDNG